MKVLVLNHTEVAQLLPMPECIAAMEAAFTSFARGASQQPLRTIFRPSKVKGVMAMMPAFRAGESPLFSLKAICVFPGNAALGKDAHQGGVMLFDGTTGELLALVNASAITAIRTAAVSALATRLLALEQPVARRTRSSARAGQIVRRWAPRGAPRRRMRRPRRRSFPRGASRRAR